MFFFLFTTRYVLEWSVHFNLKSSDGGITSSDDISGNIHTYVLLLARQRWMLSKKPVLFHFCQQLARSIVSCIIHHTSMDLSQAAVAKLAHSSDMFDKYTHTQTCCLPIYLPPHLTISLTNHALPMQYDIVFLFHNFILPTADCMHHSNKIISCFHLFQKKNFTSKLSIYGIYDNLIYLLLVSHQND